MKNIKYLSLKDNSDIFMTAHSSCLLDRHFFEKYTKQGSKEKKLREKEMELIKQQRKMEDDKRKDEERTKREEERKNRL